MKILIITNYANGLYLFRKELINALLEEQYKIMVSVPPDENCFKLEALGCEIIPTNFERRGSNPLKDLSLLLQYYRMISREKPNIVLTYTIKPNIYGGLAATIGRVPYLCNITGLGTAIQSNSIFSKLLSRLYVFSIKNAENILFQNKENIQYMINQGLRSNKIILLPGSGVNLEEHQYVSYPIEGDSIVFLAVIRIMKDKGIDEYLEAAEQIKKIHPNCIFQLVGEYEEDTRARYEPKIKDLMKRNMIQYFGHIDNVSEKMGKANVIVHPSYHEGLSNVL